MNASSIHSNRVPQTRRWYRRGQFACSAVALLSLVVALPSSWRSALTGVSAPSNAVAATRAVPPAFSDSQPQIAPIQNIQLGERLAGHNPLREQVELEEPDPETWRAISLRMKNTNGLWLWIELLRPLEWLAEHDAKVGSMIFLDLEEMGAVGDAEVTAINPCPPIEPGDGAVVTGKFKHESDGKNVVLLTIEGQAEPTGVTSNHPYWSVDRQDFVPAGQLHEGELLDTESGPRRVVAVTPTPSYSGLLYNLETTEHVYCVGSAGAIVHNDCVNLGLRQSLTSMHKKAGGWSYRAWWREGLSSADPRRRREFVEAFHQATSNAKVINFSLDGVNLRTAYTNGARGAFEIPNNVTNWEFRQVLFNPKTVFWQNGKQVPFSRVIERLGDLVE